MVKLFCAVIGEHGSAFSVDIDVSKTVNDLRNMIRVNPQFGHPNSKMELFLAKKGDAWLTENNVKLLIDTSGLKHLDTVRAKLRGVGLSDQEMTEVDEDEELAGNGPVNVLVEVLPSDVVGPPSVPLATPTGPKVDLLSCDNLLAFLDGEMINKDAIVSSPHILEADSLQFRLVGREEAIKTATQCYRDIIAIGKTTSSDRIRQPIPVCSGISGLGKTRMLEESDTILNALSLDSNQVARVIVPYFNGYSPQPVEKSMAIQASFSWRLLYRFFLAKNCKFSFDEWFQSRLPRNGGQLTLRNAINVIECKLRKKKNEEVLYLFLGIDEYQKIEKIGASPKESDTSLLRELVETIGAILCTKSPTMVLLPMFAGTDLDVIASGSIANSSFYVTERLPMTLLTMDQVFTFVESTESFAGFLRFNQIRRKLFSLGGVPRWVVEYLLELKKCSTHDDLSSNSINSCFNKIWTKYVDSYLSSIETAIFIRLAAYAVSGRTVVPNDTIDGKLKWSRLRDSSLCLLIPRKSSSEGACDVRVPYALLVNIGSLKMLERQEKAFAVALSVMRNEVDSTMYKLQAWQSWEMFGACFYAVRIHALLVLGHSKVTLGELLPGAVMTKSTRSISVKLSSMEVVNSVEKLSNETLPLIQVKEYPGTAIDWTSGGYIVVNGDGGDGVDIFFALKDAATDNLVVVVDQRKRQFGKFQPCQVNEYINKLSAIRPEFLPNSTRFVRGVLNCVASSNFATFDVPDDCFLLSRDQTEEFHGTLSYHPACSPIIPINSACKTALKSVILGNAKEVKEVVEEIVRKRKEPSGGFNNYEELRTYIQRKQFSVKVDDKHTEFSL